MLSARNISKAFDGRPVLEDVTFSLVRGGQTGLVGPSGGGKSVLLKIIGRVLAPDGGEIVSTKDDGAGRGGSESVGFLFQEGALFDSQSVIENVAFPLLVERDVRNDGGERAHGRLSPELSRSEVYDRAFSVLEDVGLADASRKYPGQLSGGMRRRVGIARALVSHPELLLLDDPTGGLDPVAASVIMELIGKLHSAYRPTVLIVSHDLRRLLPHVDRVIGLFGGHIAFDEKPVDIAKSVTPDILEFLATRFDFSQFGTTGERPHGA